ncbi:MAG TPA: DUF58 domain-containing protein [Bryobacteraceae bacterium]|nr:DUF58 domain-containing protein [Bryobacteraceae bacterium]
MLVPANRLLLLIGAIGVPAAILAVLPRGGIFGYALIAALIVAAVFDALTARRRLIGIEVRTEPVVRLWKDRESSIELTIRNERQSSMALRIGLPLPEEVPALEEEMQITLPAASEFSRVAFACRPHKRGQFFVTNCAIERSSTLGLWKTRALLPLALELRVYPNIAAERKQSPAFFRRGRLGVHGQRQLGKGKEFEKLREYSPGDSFEDIDWKATARHGHPITRVFQIERTQEVYIILDASRLTARAAADDPASTILERNVTASLLLALAAEKQGDLFGLLTFSDRIHNFVRARNGKAHYAACRDALYTLQPRMVAPDFDELFTLLRLRLRRRALLVFLTELDDPVVAERFVRNVRLIRQHVVLVGMAQPPGARALFENPEVSSLDDVYQQLAGHIQWSKLRELGQVLARQGVRFSLLESATLGPQLASLYVDLKQQQVL